jgi:hypothetical protein
VYRREALVAGDDAASPLFLDIFEEAANSSYG